MTIVYITKYALSSGPFQADVEIRDGGSLAVHKKDGYSYLFHIGEFFYTKERAVLNCQERKKKRLESLEKQIKKLENLEFNL